MKQGRDIANDLGVVRIHKNVVASVAALAASEVEGVKRIGLDFTSGFMEMLGKKSISAIKVSFDKNEEVRVDVPLIIKYECNIPEVASRVQENVRQALEKMTNLNIKDVNIVVQGIERG